jgi:hypothetical protein
VRIAWRPRVVVEGRAQLADQVRQVGLDDERVRPEMAHQLALADGAMTLGDQMFEQCERLGRQPHRGRPAPQLVRLSIEDEAKE